MSRRKTYRKDQLSRTAVSNKIKEQEAQINELNMRIAQQQSLLVSYEQRMEDLQRQLADAQYAYSVISNAASWKVTAPVRAFLDLIKLVPAFARIIDELKRLKKSGVRYIRDRRLDKRSLRRGYFSLGELSLYTQGELTEQRGRQFGRKIKFSIVVPLYNTPENFLYDMLLSVQNQTYENWELCLADGSDGEHARVGQICKRCFRRDKRIKYRKLKRNYGISGNTNACLEMATGDYIGLLDHDDILHPAALYEVMTAICEQDADFIYTDEATFESPDLEKIITRHYKPDFAPDNLRANNYICHFSVFSDALLKQAGRFRSKYNGAQDYDMILRLTEQAGRIVHIPKILYFWRGHADSVSLNIDAKTYAGSAGRQAVSAHLRRVGLRGEVIEYPGPFIYKIKYELRGCPKVSILIPNNEHKKDLERCLNAIYQKTTYPDFEVILIENNSKSKEIFSYYKQVQKKWANLKVVVWEGSFNYSGIHNYGATFALGQYLLLLNNATEVLTQNWIQEMLMYAQRSDVGAVGAKLYYPDDTVQHGGVILGMGGIAGHAHRRFARDNFGYMGRLNYAQDMSAVTGACMMVRRDVWDETGGLNEDFALSFNDVDLCMRIRKKGYLIVWTPHAELYHYESKSRGVEDTPWKRQRTEGEIRRFKELWSKELAKGDPYYNPNLNLEREDFSWK